MKLRQFLFAIAVTLVTATELHGMALDDLAGRVLQKLEHMPSHRSIHLNTHTHRAIAPKRLKVRQPKIAYDANTDPAEFVVAQIQAARKRGPTASPSNMDFTTINGAITQVKKDVTEEYKSQCTGSSTAVAAAYAKCSTDATTTHFSELTTKHANFCEKNGLYETARKAWANVQVGCEEDWTKQFCPNMAANSCTLGDMDSYNWDTFTACIDGMKSSYDAKKSDCNTKKDSNDNVRGEITAACQSYRDQRTSACTVFNACWDGADSMHSVEQSGRDNAKDGLNEVLAILERVKCMLAELDSDPSADAAGACPVDKADGDLVKHDIPKPSRPDCKAWMDASAPIPDDTPCGMTSDFIVNDAPEICSKAPAAAAMVSGGSSGSSGSSFTVASIAGEYEVWYKADTVAQADKRTTNMIFGCDGKAAQPGIFEDSVHTDNVATKCSQARDADAQFYVEKTHGSTKFECLHVSGSTVKGYHYAPPPTEDNGFWGTVEYKLIKKTTCGSGSSA